MRTAGPRLRRIFDSSRAPASDVADRLPGIFEDHNLVVRKTPGFGRWPGDRGRTGTRCRRARAASRPGSQHGDLGELLGRAVAVLGQPADVSEASQRPPCADEVAVDVGAVAGDDVAKVLGVSRCDGRQPVGAMQGVVRLLGRILTGVVVVVLLVLDQVSEQ